VNVCEGDRIGAFGKRSLQLAKGDESQGRAWQTALAECGEVDEQVGQSRPINQLTQRVRE